MFTHWLNAAKHSKTRRERSPRYSRVSERYSQGHESSHSHTDEEESTKAGTHDTYNEHNDRKTSAADSGICVDHFFSSSGHINTGKALDHNWQIDKNKVYNKQNGIRQIKPTGVELLNLGKRVTMDLHVAQIKKDDEVNKNVEDKVLQNDSHTKPNSNVSLFLDNISEQSEYVGTNDDLDGTGPPEIFEQTLSNFDTQSTRL